MAHATDITGYTFNADTYCPGCIVPAMGLIPVIPHSAAFTVETNLNLIAEARGIDRYAEESFDSSEFPKVVFRDMMSWEEQDICGQCHGTL